MIIEPLSDEILAETAALRKAHSTAAEAARAAGVPVRTFQHRLKIAAKRGLLGFTPPVIEGFEVKQISSAVDGAWVKQVPEHGEEFKMPSGQVLRRVSALVDADNRIIQQWVMTKEGGDGIDWVSLLKDAFKDYEGKSQFVMQPDGADIKFCNLIPCNDWHVNMLTWGREVGTSWDLKIAEKVIGDAMETVISRARKGGLAIILGGGDLMHNDDNTNRTAKSGNVLDADSRYMKGVEVAQRLKVRTIDAALKNNTRVLVRILPGNHDEYSSVAIAHFLAAWYRNEPRVTVDLDASLYWWHRFGRVLLGATHGHTVKMAQMPGIMAHRCAEDWGQTKFRYIHTFHIHHIEKVATEGNGVICESHQAPIPQDSWHFGAGYLAGRTVQVITYHQDHGEYGRTTEAIIDPPDLPAGLTRGQHGKEHS